MPEQPKKPMEPVKALYVNALFSLMHPYAVFLYTLATSQKFLNPGQFGVCPLLHHGSLTPAPSVPPPVEFLADPQCTLALVWLKN